MGTGKGEGGRGTCRKSKLNSPKSILILAVKSDDDDALMMTPMIKRKKKELERKDKDKDKDKEIYLIYSLPGSIQSNSLLRHFLPSTVHI